MEEKITYFEEPGKINTEETLRLVKERALRRGIKKAVLATHTGFTVAKALDIFRDTGIKLIIVQGGGVKAWINTDLIEKAEREGHSWLRRDKIKMSTYHYPELAQNTLRRFCEGMKVCVQIVLMATEAGMISKGEEVIAVGGTGYYDFEERGGGADTAVVMEAIDSRSFFDVSFDKEERRKFKEREGRKIKEIICKPI